jgi:hypothetical protein
VRERERETRRERETEVRAPALLLVAAVAGLAGGQARPVTRTVTDLKGMLLTFKELSPLLVK